MKMSGTKWLWVAVVTAMVVVPGSVGADEVQDYYKVPPIYNPYPGGGRRYRDWNVRNFGPVGIGITLTKPVFTMKVRNVEAGSPAEATGKLKKGQIIESINGVVLKDRDPREVFGDIITDAEAKDGKIKLQIKDFGEVVVQIPVMGRYSKTWPLNCPKSDKIVRNLADLLAKSDKPSGGAVLFLLSTGEEKDLEVVRKWMANTTTIGGYPWDKGYKGPGLCEYYLRTGDETVLPVIKQMTEELKVLEYNGGWSGRGKASFTYMSGGQMHAAGVHCLTFLLMAKYCGVDVDEGMLQRSLKAFYAFSGRGNVAYGDQLPEGGFRDNGKSGGLAMAMAAATRLMPDGEESVYAKARDISAMKSFYATSWFHAAHTGGGIGEIWHNCAMSLMDRKRPVQYRSFFDTRRCIMELSRRWNGGIGIAGMDDRYDRSCTEDGRGWGTYFALAYTLPRRKLQLSGAAQTKWCKNYKLPGRPWGTAADDMFQLMTPVPAEGAITMKELLKEDVYKDASAPLMGRVNAAPAEDTAILTKYLNHPEFGIRCATMRAAVNKGRSDLVVPSLKSKDPRARHNGILAITGMFKGRGLPADKLTPEMFELVGKIIEDKNESWWVVQDACHALRRADNATIAKHRDRLIELLDVDSWWVQAAAARALARIAVEEEHYRKVLPPVVKTIAGFTVDTAQWTSAKDLAGVLKGASADVKKFAYPLLKTAYAAMPDELVFPGGQLVPNGGITTKNRISSLLETLPGGTDFVIMLPKKTSAYAASGKDEDLYRYSGKFEPNDAVVGTWHWAVWPRPKTEEGVEKAALSWVAGMEKRKENPKDVLKLSADGKVKSGHLKRYIWSGDMLIGVQDGMARKMEVRNYGGKDFLIFENGGFEKGKVPADWNQTYDIYMRAE